jgi:hypothetical protein
MIKSNNNNKTVLNSRLLYFLYPPLLSYRHNFVRYGFNPVKLFIITLSILGCLSLERSSSLLCDSYIKLQIHLPFTPIYVFESEF